ARGAAQACMVRSCRARGGGRGGGLGAQLPIDVTFPACRTRPRSPGIGLTRRTRLQVRLSSPWSRSSREPAEGVGMGRVGRRLLSAAVTVSCCVALGLMAVRPRLSGDQTRALAAHDGFTLHALNSAPPVAQYVPHV